MIKDDVIRCFMVDRVVFSHLLELLVDAIRHSIFQGDFSCQKMSHHVAKRHHANHSTKDIGTHLLLP